MPTHFIGVACVKNEADIVEAFVRHNLAYLDRMIVLDHGSSDDTYAILKSLQDEGLALDVHRDFSLGKFQGEKMTLLMRQAAEQGAKWIVLLDGDEFIRTPEVRLPPPAEEGPGVLLVAHVTYTAYTEKNSSELNPVLRLQYRLASEPSETLNLQERKGHLKAIVRRDIALHPEVCVVQGNHEILIGGSEVSRALCDKWTLAHYSLRSPDQYASKVIINALQKLCMQSVMANHSSFYIKHLELIRANYQQYLKDFPGMLPAYIEKAGHQARLLRDPLCYQGGPLRYSTEIPDISRLITNLVNYSETLARSFKQQPSATAEHPKARLTFLLSLGETPAGARDPVTAECELMVAETVSLPLHGANPDSFIKIEWRGPIGLVECQLIRLHHENGTVLELQGKPLIDILELEGDARFIPHEHYFVFVKEIGPVTLTIPTEPSIGAGPWKLLELRFVYDTDPAHIGTRFIQARPLASDVEQRKRIAYLEKKVSDLVTVGGFLKHQMDWIWSSFGRRK